MRRKLDPYEWWDDAWGLKIRAAEIWMELELEVAPGKRGNSNKTSARILEAQRLAKAGFGKGEIAAKLAVTPSAISKWLKRKPELKSVF